MSLVSPLGVVRSRRAGVKVDEAAMTAVIEYLSAFILFLMLVTAFLSLAQIRLGPNQPEIDLLESSAVLGVGLLTGSEGIHIPFVNGSKDNANSTSDWHLRSADELNDGILLPGLLQERGRLSELRVSALKNITEQNFRAGLGMPNEYSVRLMIRVETSTNSSRLGMLLFDDGTKRTNADQSVSVSRTMRMGAETVLISLEVHRGAGFTDRLEMHEIMIEPAGGGSEWFELYNPDQFATNLSGWGVVRLSGGVVAAQILLASGVAPGGTHILLTGNPAIQTDLGASVVIDLGPSGVLGSGGIDALAIDQGELILQFAEFNSALTYDILSFKWDASWNVVSDYSLQWQGGDLHNSTNWLAVQGGTPGAL